MQVIFDVAPEVGHIDGMISRRPPPDPIYQAVELLTDGWSWLILYVALFDGVTRFNEFQNALGIARKVLSARLDSLTEGGVFRREPSVHQQGRFEYVPTEMGRDFFACLIVAIGWGQNGFGGSAGLSQHRHYRHQLRPVLCCSACDRPVVAREVEVVSIYRASADLAAAKRRRAPNFALKSNSAPPALMKTLQVFGDKWSGLLIRECFLGTHRFGDFQKYLGIAPNILAMRLDRLIDFGVLVARRAGNHPDRYDYRLTTRGLDLYAVPLALLTWSEKWLSTNAGRTQLKHRLCGKRFTAVLRCATCLEHVAAEDVISAG